MPVDLGTRLVAAGLVSAAGLEEALAMSPRHDVALVRILIERGLSDERLARHFADEGFGPIVSSEELGAASGEALAPSIPRVVQEEFALLPLRYDGARWVVAMAVPTDRHAILEVERLVRAPIAARVVRWGEVCTTSREAEPPVALVRRRDTLTPASAIGAPARGGAPVDPALDEAIPLVRLKSLAPRPQAPMAALPHRLPRRAPTPLYTEVARSPGPRELLRRELTRGPQPHRSDAEETSAPGTARIPTTSPNREPSAPPPRATSSGWASLPSPAPRPEPRRRRRPRGEPRPRAAGGPSPSAPSPSGPSPSGPSDPSSAFAALRRASELDVVVQLTLEASLTFSRSAVFFVLRRGILRGRGGVGPHIGEDAARNLWIPIGTPSLFRDVVESRVPYVGPYGAAIADGLFRATVGSRGGPLGLAPIEVSDKVVGLLATDGVALEARAVLERLRSAVGRALERIIVTRKHA